MESIKTVLIVDDNQINREILKKFLKDHYNIVEAENGQVALDILTKNRIEFSAVLLDLTMPVMDGYTFLQHIQEDSRLKNVPIIVTTSHSESEKEIEALKMGAWDFVTKPYNPDIILFRLRNAINRSQLETLREIVYLTEFDKLTGLFTKNHFFAETHKMLTENPKEKFIFVRFDIDRFSLINSYFGIAQGDRLIKYIAGTLPSLVKTAKYYTYGRIEGDVFAACVSFNGLKYQDKYEFAVDVVDRVKKVLGEYNREFDIVPSFGLYEIPDNSIRPDILYDRSTLAAKTCKGSYIQLYSWYDDSMEQQLKQDQNIANEMTRALEENQFVPFFQPKYDLRTNKIAGAEALIRWQHPEKGLIPPASFIPVFERNGFVSKVDYYMWENVCKTLRKWIDEGRTILPISINVSRIDLYNPLLVDVFCNLIDKYQIPPNLLNLEITESSYMDNPEIMLETMHRLQKKGFVVMMDDFGSGYSSLNVLKDMPVDVLKIDMKFLSNDGQDGRSESIIASIVRMAKWLNMTCIAEGAETFNQVQFLKNIGCEFAQGYFYSKPIPQEEYEALVEKEYGSVGFDVINSLEDMFSPRNQEKFTNIFWAGDSEIAKYFLEIKNPAAIYEFNNGHYELLRVNSKYYEYFDFSCNPTESPIITQSLMKCAKTRQSTTMDYSFTNSEGKIQFVSLKTEYLKELGDKHILLGIHDFKNA